MLTDEQRIAVTKICPYNRQRQILTGVCRGLLNKEIAHKLCISERTVKFHLGIIYKNLNIYGNNCVYSRIYLIKWAIKIGLYDVSSEKLGPEPISEALVSEVKSETPWFDDPLAVGCPV